MFHIELRQFPFNACRFNLGEDELLELLDPWVRDRSIEMDERKWNPQHARITVLEGPELAIQELTMGRGWRSAERRSKDVTEEILERARGPLAQAATQASAAAQELAPTADGAAADVGAPSAAGVPELEPLLGDDPGGLLQAWRLVAGRRPELTPSESLALAEQTLRSLG